MNPLLLLCAADGEAELRSEIAAEFPGDVFRQELPLLYELHLKPGFQRPLPFLAFARQCFPGAKRLEAGSIRAWSERVLDEVATALPDNQPWFLHIGAHYGAKPRQRLGARAWHTARRVGRSFESPSVNPSGPASEAGGHRCQLIREAVLETLRQKRRSLLRSLRPNPLPFTDVDSLVQLLLTSPDSGYLSVAPAPLPFEARHLISPFPKGEIPVAQDKAAPSRAFAKLVEAELRLGRAIQEGERCVDLGAAPGSWTYVAAGRGAKVIAVDRAPLREDLMRHPAVTYRSGDAFEFTPRSPVDWLLCDVIAEPEKVTDLIERWLRNRWCRHFVVTLKIKDNADPRTMSRVKRRLRELAPEAMLLHLCANKKEICAMGPAGVTGALDDLGESRKTLARTEDLVDKEL